ncbi:MarR family transcriptional regulator [Enterocloster asparagiformis]|jgi:DNA-binding MarR family transcriptional regulator|uniref:MarR family transcriptional regulator n=1 Tax=Enterocloster asparagiformis TaxID=333367 RepID=A0A413FLM2_9FIRM|nr:MarR family winged helix-turn-helix transcriptional regulator [Enterocloster asparagiformis]RGX33215.1 MarR family transcriptional regulator [Enterocloster asparagiformis]
MNLIWLGKYKSFFENLSLYTNVYEQAYTVQGIHGTSVPCSLAQIQVLEYILENEEENQKMSEVARRLGLSPSAFSKNIKKMMDKQLLEKYRCSNNRKDIILKASPLGRKVYQEYMNSLWKRQFEKTFAMLDQIPEEYIARFAEILKFNAEAMLVQMDELQNRPAPDTEKKAVTLVKIE